MKKKKNECTATDFSRRDLIAAGTGLAALAGAPQALAAGRRLSADEGLFRMTSTRVMQIDKDPRLDLDDPVTNFRAMLKLRNS